VIQIFTRASSFGRGGLAASVELASRGTQRLSASAVVPLGWATRLSAGAARVQTDGFSAIDPALQKAANPDADGYRNTSGWFGLSHAFGARDSAQVRVSHSTNQLDYDSAFGAPKDLQRSKTEQNQITASSSHRFGAFGLPLSLQLAAGHSTDRSQDSDNGAFGYADDYTSTNRSASAQLQVELDEWRVQVGLERQRASIVAHDGFGGGYNEARNANAIRLGAAWSTGGHQLEANLRRDSHSGSSAETTHRLGYGFQLNRQLKLIASAATAFTVAPLGYLYAPFFGNPQLKPEFARSRELGAQFSARGHSLRITAFSQRVRNEIEYDFGSSRFENIAQSRNRGVELNWGAKLAGVNWSASITEQSPENATTGQRLNRRAASLANVGASAPVAWFGASGEAGLNLRHQGARLDGARELGAGQLLDVHWRAALPQLSPGVSLKARIDNLSNRQQSAAFGYNSTPRTVALALSWKQ
jgi:vitamin B12 transporter